MSGAGTFDVIEIDQVIAAVKMQLDLESITDYDAKIEYFVNEAAGKIDSNRLYVKKPVILDIVNGKAKLPKGFAEIVAIRLICETDHNHPIAFDMDDINNVDINNLPRSNTMVMNPSPRQNELIYVDQKFLGDCHGASVIPRETVEIDSGYLFITQPSAVTKVELAWKGMHCDEYGLFVVLSDWEECMREYATYKMLEIRPNLWNKQFFQFYRDAKDNHYANYVAAKGKIISVDAKREFEANKYMIKRCYQAIQWDRNKRW